jgi:hypothetical protein
MKTLLALLFVVSSQVFATEPVSTSVMPEGPIERIAYQPEFNLFAVEHRMPEDCPPNAMCAPMTYAILQTTISACYADIVDFDAKVRRMNGPATLLEVKGLVKADRHMVMCRGIKMVAKEVFVGPGYIGKEDIFVSNVNYKHGEIYQPEFKIKKIWVGAPGCPEGAACTPATIATVEATLNSCIDKEVFFKASVSNITFPQLTINIESLAKTQVPLTVRCYREHKIQKDVVLGPGFLTESMINLENVEIDIQ